MRSRSASRHEAIRRRRRSCSCSMAMKASSSPRRAAATTLARVRWPCPADVSSCVRTRPPPASCTASPTVSYTPLSILPADPAVAFVGRHPQPSRQKTQGRAGFLHGLRAQHCRPRQPIEDRRLDLPQLPEQEWRPRGRGCRVQGCRPCRPPGLGFHSHSRRTSNLRFESCPLSSTTTHIGACKAATRYARRCRHERPR